MAHDTALVIKLKELSSIRVWDEFGCNDGLFWGCTGGLICSIGLLCGLKIFVEWIELFCDGDLDKKFEFAKGLEADNEPSAVGGDDPSSLRLTICCIKAKVPPESTCKITHIVSIKKKKVYWTKIYIYIYLLLRSNPSRQHSKVLYPWQVRRRVNTGKHGKVGVKRKGWVLAQPSYYLQETRCGGEPKELVSPKVGRTSKTAGAFQIHSFKMRIAQTQAF